MPWYGGKYKFHQKDKVERMSIAYLLDRIDVLGQTDPLINVERFEQFDVVQDLLLAEVDEDSVFFNLEPIYL
jgi:hypothetical protein